MSRSRWIVKMVWLVGGIGLVLVLQAWRDQPDVGRLHMFFLDTPGDAVLIQTPRGGYVLVDGGEDGGRLPLLLGEIMPFWCRTLDAVILTRADLARLPGQVAALGRYRARVALAPAGVFRSHPTAYPTQVTEYLNEWQQMLAEGHTPVYPAGDAAKGMQMDLGGAIATVWPAGSESKSDADTALVLQVAYGESRVVLAGAGADRSFLLERQETPPLALLAYPWQDTIPPLLHERWWPQAIVFMDGQEREPPALHTYAERARGGAVLFHPKLNGTIEFVSDGRDAWVVSER